MVVTEDSGGQAERLVPLPRRNLDDGPDDAPGLPPPAVVAELLERTLHQLATLESDVEGLRADQEAERKRIEEEREARLASAEAAAEVLIELGHRAREIAAKKARTDDLELALSASVELDASKAFDALVAELEEEVKLAKGITGAIRIPVIGGLLKQAMLQIEAMRDEAEQLQSRLIEATEEEVKSEGKHARASYEIGMALVKRDLQALEQRLPLSGVAWADRRWRDWQPPTSVTRWIRFGELYLPDLEKIRYPALFGLHDGPGLAFDVAADREGAIGAARSVLARVLASIPPGGVRFTFVDPNGLGDSIAPFLPLGAYREDLLDPVCTLEDEIENRLTEITQHIELVIAQQLRGVYATLDECNEQLGEIAEPYRVLAIFDFPNRFTDRARELFRTIVDNGARSGVHVVMVSAPNAARASGARWGAMLSGLQVVKEEGDGFAINVEPTGAWWVQLDQQPDAVSGAEALLKTILTTTGDRARTERRSEVSLDRVLDLVADGQQLGVRTDLPVTDGQVRLRQTDTWWAGVANRNAAAAIGRAGPRDAATLSFDSTGRAAALVLGGARSGKSTLLHTFVLALAAVYPPEELELYLVQFGAGGGFAVYADDALPHARAVATASEREFAVSVLDEATDELDRRAALFRAASGERAGLEGYREQSGERLPRVIVVIDGIQELLGENDRLTDRAAQLLARLAREGGSYGIHLVVTAERLVQLTALGRTLDHLRVRVALPSVSEDDLRVLADDVADLAGATPQSIGEAAQVALGSGEVASCKVAMVELHERGVLVREMRRLAGERGFDRVPQVLEGTEVAHLADSAMGKMVSDAETQRARLKPRLWLGEPLSIGSPVEVMLKRQEGANLVVVGEDERLGQGVLLAALASAVLGHGDELVVHVLDLMPIEAGFAESAKQLSSHARVQVHRRRRLPELVQAVGAEIARRLDARDYRAVPVLFAVNGVGLARDLDAAAAGDPAKLVKGIESIVVDGPEVGVHTLVWAHSPGALAQRLSAPTLRGFALRVVLQLEAADSEALIDSAAAASLKQNQALLYDDESVRLVRFRPYTLATPADVTRLMGPPRPTPDPPPDP